MSDMFNADTSFDAASEFTGQSAFVPMGPPNFEANLEAMGLVEDSWRMPALPDLVKLDLASSPAATPESLTQLLSGIDRDFNEPDDDEEPLVPRQQLSGLDQARIVLAANTSNPPPQQLSTSAVERFKLRAIDAGLLDMQPERADATWSPEMNRIRGELAFDDYNRSLRGDRPGAVPFGRAMQVLGDLTSPMGLLSMATELDFLPDIGNIQDEWSTWGDKWRKLADEGMSKGPLQFAKNFVDAFTGPVDDVVFPIINTGLLFSGFGLVTNTARVGWMGRNLARAAVSFDRLWGSTRMGRAATRALRGIGEGLEASARLNLDELARPSMLSNRLTRGVRTATEAGEEAGRLSRFANWNGERLAQWRGLAPVVYAKRGTQAGMRLGLAAYAQEAFPGYQGGGASLSDIPAVAGAADWLRQRSYDPKFMPLELAFAPYNIFAPGTFFRRAGEGAGMVARTGSGVVKALGTTPGRAVAGGVAGATVGALAGDDAGDIAEGALAGAGAAAALPAAGRALGVERIHQGLTGALVGAAGGALLGDSPEDVALGALAGTGIVFLPNTVRKRFYQQVGVSGLDRLLRGVGHAMVRTNYQLVEADTDIAMGFHAKMKRLLADSTDELRQWEFDVNSYGVVGALAQRSYGKVDQGTRDLAAAAIAFDYTTFASDWIAHAQSRAASGTRRQRHAFHMARNKIINQLRPIDLARDPDDLIDDVAKVMAWTDTRGVGIGGDRTFTSVYGPGSTKDALFKVRRRQRAIADALRRNPERVLELAEEHNKQIAPTIAQLFEQRNFPRVDDFADVPRSQTNLFGQDWADMQMPARAALYANHGGWDNFGDFREFVSVTDEIRRARGDHVFDAAVLKPVTTRRGRQRAPKAGAGVDFFDPTSMDAQRALSDVIARGVDPKTLGNLRVTPLASAHEAGRVTPARLDFVTKQQVEEMADKVADVLSIQTLLGKVKPGWLDALSGGPSQLLPAAQMDRAQMRVAMEELVAAGVKRGSAKQLLSFARFHGLTLADLAAGVNRIGDKLLAETDWTRYGFGDVATNSEGRILSGVDALRARHRELKDKAPFTAAELDLDALAKYYDDQAVPKVPTSFNRTGSKGKEAFRALGDDETVTVYHATSGANADSIVASGEIRPGKSPKRTNPDIAEEEFDGMGSWDGDAMYVTADIDDLMEMGYGSEIVAINVRKGDLAMSSEARSAVDNNDVADALFHKETGAIVKAGTPFTARRVSRRAAREGLDDVAAAGQVAAPAINDLLREGLAQAGVLRAKMAAKLEEDVMDLGLVDSLDDVGKATTELNAGLMPWNPNWDTLTDQTGPLDLVRSQIKGTIERFENGPFASLGGSIHFADLQADLDALNAVDMVIDQLLTLPEDRFLAGLRHLSDNDSIDNRLRALLVQALDHMEGVPVAGARRVDPQAAAKAARVRALAADADARGYKLVHGVEFLSPEDVAFGTPIFGDATRRHMNAVTLGNWFGRRQPIEAWARDDMRRRLKIVEHLARVGKDVNPSDKEVSNILDTLESWLRHEQDVTDEALRLAHQQGGIGEKTVTRIKSSLTPIRLDDAAGFSRRKHGITKKLTDIGYSETEAEAIWKAVGEFRQSGFSEVGLWGLEAELRNRNQAAGFLKMLAGTRYGDSVLARAGGQAAAGATIGAAVQGGDASWEDRLKGAIAGGAVGAGVAAAVRPKAIAAAEGWRYGYLVDGYARLRDSMRFTLSPFFDLSRYTEGLMLSQTAVPTRAPDGSRLAVPVFSEGLVPVAALSPTGLRRRLARQAMKGRTLDDGTVVAGKAKAEAKAVALSQYEGFVDEFNAASKASRDFDRDAIDSVGRWYRQVGVLGFSPTDWMATAYAHLRGRGFDQVDAYKAAREMYSYGTSARSAAEMSVNFVFFPFSFQKKALTHIGKWLNDDLGRSIVLHDAFKTYETLDEKYNLDERWKAHIPYLQQLQRLNLFAYGISPGRFGGINSQLFEGVGKVAINAFLPVGAKIQDASAASELRDIGRQLLPVANDINWMMHDTREVLIPNVAGVFTPMDSMSYRAQVGAGWEQYNRVRDDYEAALAERGYTLSDLYSKPWLAEGLVDYEARIAEVAEKYPAWWDARKEIPGNAIALSMEKDLWIQRAMAGDPSVDARQMFEMQSFIDGLLDRMELLHSTRDPQFAPAEMYSMIQAKAVELAGANPSFRPLWNRFWRRDWGLIDEPMVLP